MSNNQLPADMQNLGLTDRVVLEAKQFAFYNYCSAANNADFDNLETWPYAAQVAYYSICNYMSGSPICWPYSTKTIPMDLKDAAFETALQQWKEQKEVEPVKEIEYMPVHPEDTRKPGCPKQIPMSLLDEDHAQRNHGQTLKRLKERGGLGVLEILAIIDKKPWSYYRDLKWQEALNMLNDTLTNPPK